TPPPLPPGLVPAATPAVLLFTSGSGARPRGVLHSHESLMWNCTAVAREMLHLSPRDVMLGALPLGHSFGLSAVLNASLLAGNRVELMPHFDVEAAWSLIRDREVTVITGVPTMFRRLAAHAFSSRNTDLRLGVVSGAPCGRELAGQVRQRMGMELIERYGMTEASPLTWRTTSELSPEGDVGHPGWGVRVRAVDPGGKVLATGQAGELEVRAPGMMLGYLDRNETTSRLRDGWLLTGDLGQVREDGGVTLLGRLKEVILRGGHSISAREVENALRRHPQVEEAVVVGVPDPDLGEEIAAAVIGRNGAAPRVEELEALVRGQLSSYKRPRRWLVVESLPRTSLGKVRRDEVVALFAASLHG
ncbi:MAG: class I adenylate-forming enzyme family protein, partial [Candidatus Dormibacteria bacterium]